MQGNRNLCPALIVIRFGKQAAVGILWLVARLVTYSGKQHLEVLMGERTLRGARLGGQSFEDERGIEFAARQNVGYACPQGHVFEIPMALEADVPAAWECPRCGAEGMSVSGIKPAEKNEKLSLIHISEPTRRTPISY